MGRIAEAMRKAQAERVEVIRLAGGPPPPGTPANDIAPPPPHFAQEQSPAEAQPPAKPLAGIDESIVCLTEPACALAEQYRGLRTWLLRHNTTNEHRSLVITSSVPNEGKSVTALNLAVTLAEVKHLSVLVLDADLRRGSLAKLLNRADAPGMADVLSGAVSLNDAIHPTGVRNLSLLPAGRTTTASFAELFSSRTTAALFDEVRERFHYVIVDTPAVQTAADVGVIGGLCSGILLVVRMGRTPEPVVKQSARWLQANNLNVLGCVLTAADGRSNPMPHPFGIGGRTPA